MVTPARMLFDGVRALLVATFAGWGDAMSFLRHDRVLGRLLVLTAFVAYGCIGLSAYTDYGIHWDFDNNRHYAAIAVQAYHDLLTGAEIQPQAQYEHEKIHGPAFELYLSAVEYLVGPASRIDKVHLNHLMVFGLFFASTIAFYHLCKRHFESWRMGLLGAVLLVLSPRIFAHSFYNSVDIATLSYFIFSICTLVNFLDRKSLAAAALHAVTCGILVDIRNFGIFVPLLTFLFVALDAWQSDAPKTYAKRIIPPLILYVCVLAAVIVLLWPYLWEAPVANFLGSFRSTVATQWDGTIVYLGRYVRATALPWHYNLVWILITTPLSYSIMFAVGIFAALESSLRGSNDRIHTRNNMIFILWLAVPLLVPMVLHTALFDGWRHHFFVYPAFLLFALTGVRYVSRRVRLHGCSTPVRTVAAAVMAIFSVSLLHTAHLMVSYHPFQNLYFNALAGTNIRHDFEMDYWGLSYRQALEYILENDPAPVVEVAVANEPGRANAQLLAPEDRARLRYTDLDAAKYFLSEYRYHREDYPYENEFYSIEVGGEKIMVVYRLR